MTGLQILTGCGVGFAASLAVTGFTIAARVGDVPDTRSSHSVITPTCGGLGILAGLGATWTCWAFMASVPPGLAPILALAAAMGLVGLQDDLFGIRPMVKFALIAAIGVLTVNVIGPARQIPLGVGGLDLPVPVAWAGSVLWVFVVVNGVNFMDGLNGMMGACMNAAFVGLGGISLALGAPGAGWLSVAMMAALLGFLPYNFGNRARIFAGDAGSLVVGFAYAAATLRLIAESPIGVSTLYVGPLLILPFLADVLLTMLRRAIGREAMLSAHRSHLYQRLNRSGISHVGVVNIYIVAIALMAVIAVGALRMGLMRSGLGFAGVVAGLTLLYLAGSLYARRSTT